MQKPLEDDLRELRHESEEYCITLLHNTSKVSRRILRLFWKRIVEVAIGEWGVGGGAQKNREPETVVILAMEAEWGMK